MPLIDIPALRRCVLALAAGVVAACSQTPNRAPVEDRGQVSPPDIASVDDAERKNKPLRRLGEDGIKLAGSPDEIEVQTGDRQLERDV